MVEARGTTWRAEYGELAEREQFRVGYVGSQSYEGYFPIGQLSDLIAVLTTASSAAVTSLTTGTAVQARTSSTGFRIEVAVEPRSDQFPVQIMRFDRALIGDLISTLTALSGMLSAGPGDWDNTKPFPIPLSMIPLNDIVNSPQLSATYARRVTVDIRDFGAVDGAPDNTDEIAAAVAAAGEGGIVVYPLGLWITDPIAGMDGQEHQVYGTVRLRGQSLASIPVVGTANGVIYFYGTSENRFTSCGVRLIGGTIDGNRRGMTNIGSAPNGAYDMEGINFKYCDYWYVAGEGTVFDAIESGIDADLSTHGYTSPGIVSRDNYGNGFHMSNGAIDNVVDGVAIGNGFGNNRHGADQYAGSSPQANRNIFRVKAYNNYQNFRIEGASARVDGVVSIGGTIADVITAELTSLDPTPTETSIVFAATPPSGGATVDAEARMSLAALRAGLVAKGEIVGGSDATAAPVLAVSDDFNRGNGALGGAWSGGGFEINSNAMRRTAASTGIGGAYLPGIGTPNVSIRASIKLSSTRVHAGFAFRATLSDFANSAAEFLIVDIGIGLAADNGVRIRKRLGGSNTALVVATPTLTLGATYELRADVLGDTILVYLDGILVLSYVLTAAEYEKYGKLGYAAAYSNKSGTQDAGDTTWDNWQVFKLTPA